jgi:hypothetical protein
MQNLPSTYAVLPNACRLPAARRRSDLAEPERLPPRPTPRQRKQQSHPHGVASLLLDAWTEVWDPWPQWRHCRSGAGGARDRSFRPAPEVSSSTRLTSAKRGACGSLDRRRDRWLSSEAGTRSATMTALLAQREQAPPSSHQAKKAGGQNAAAAHVASSATGETPPISRSTAAKSLISTCLAVTIEPQRGVGPGRRKCWAEEEHGDDEIPA